MSTHLNIAKKSEFFFALVGLFCFSLLQATTSYAEYSKHELKCADLLTETVFKDNKSALKTTGHYVTTDGYPIYFEYYSHPEATETLVVANGFSYDLDNYQVFVRSLLEKRPLNILVSNYRAQNKSYEKAKNYNFSWAGLTTDLLVADLIELTQFLQIEGPFHLVGLSFGSSVAAQLATHYAAQVKSITLIAPLIKLANAYQVYRSVMVWLDPFNLWNTRYPAPVEALLATIAKFDLSQYRFSQPTTVILAEKEDSYLLGDQKAYLKKVSQKQQLEALIVEGSDHAIPSSKPKELAKIFEDLIFKE